jgi:hypothetical protein
VTVLIVLIQLWRVKVRFRPRVLFDVQISNRADAMPTSAWA